MYDVAIIGCGIVGAAAAYTLSKYQLKILVLERENDVASGTTKANSAIIHAGYDPKPGTLMAALNVQGARMTRALCEKLDVPYRQIGSLVLAMDETEEPTLSRLYQQGIQNGVEGLRLLNRKEALALEPGISSQVKGALYAPSAAIVSPWELCIALTDTAMRNGVELKLCHQVQGLSRDQTCYTITTNRGVFQARYLINAAGVHADAVHNMAAPPAFAIHPSRGEYYLMDKSQGGQVGHVVFQCPSKSGKGVLAAPTVHGNLIVGPTAQPVEDGDDVATSTDGLEQVRLLSQRSVPGISFREAIRCFAGVRARSDREDFVIEEAAGAPGLIDLAGIQSPGLSAAPAIALRAVELLRKAGLALREKKAYNDSRKVIRFRELPLERQRRLIQQNPLYGRVICRCETITEGEIVDAIHTPTAPRTLDAIKRRCGAGMGRCQGGFCSPRVQEILSRELDIPMEQVLLDQEGSVILMGRTKEPAAGSEGGSK